MSILQCPHGNSAAFGVCPNCYPDAMSLSNSRGDGWAQPTPEAFLQNGLLNGTWTPPTTVHNHAEGVCLVCDPPDYPPRGTDEVAADERCVHGKRHDEPCNEGACKSGYFQTGADPRDIYLEGGDTAPSDPRDLTGRSSDDEPHPTLRECANCGDPFAEPGALLFSPPREDGSVLKLHICVPCWDALSVT